MTGVVTIVGGGASGTLTAVHLLRESAAAGGVARTSETGDRLHIELCEPSRIGTGLAYSTQDSRHRLNVAARGMSAFPDDPSHFLRWLHRHVDPDYPPGGFAPRSHYADYLAHCLTDARAAAPGVRFTQHHRGVRDVTQRADGLLVTLDGGATLRSDAVVLATGNGPPSLGWAPEQLRTSPRFLADPWRTQPSATPGPGDTVVLVGAGLTMVDMARRWGRRGVQVHVVSRHGLLPLPHSRTPATPLPPPDLPATGPLGLAEVRRAVFAQVEAAGGDWRRAIDGLRPITADLWRRLDRDARGAFLRSASRRWDRVRHRVDPDLHAWLTRRCRDGSITVHTGTVVGAGECVDGVRVTLSDSAVLDAALVVNCTGTCVPTRHRTDPLVRSLFATGLARPGVLDLGLATDDGRLIRPNDGPPPAIWAVGPLRRGELWESTAIPEIRCQAAGTARQVFAALRGARPAATPSAPRRGERAVVHAA